MTQASSDDAVTAFVARWQAADGSELANYQLFVLELRNEVEPGAASFVRGATRVAF